MSLREPTPEKELIDRAVVVLAVVAAVSVANGYYIQPLLAEVGTAVALPQMLA